MAGQQEAGLTQALQAREVAQAQAAARGGELSAVVALRRDMTNGPASDYPGEPWGAVVQSNTAIAGGRFSLRIDDAQARFNINLLRGGDILSAALVARAAAAYRLPQDTAARVTAFLDAAGPLRDVTDLRRAGVDATVLARLEPFVTALPGRTTVNLNTAPEPLLALLVGDAVAAHVLADKRRGTGQLTPADFQAAQVLIPPGTGFTSDHYRVITTVTIGGTTQTLTSLLERRRSGEQAQVVVLSRDYS